MAKICVAAILAETAHDVHFTLRDQKWARLPAYLAGQVNQRLLLRNEYPIAENRVLRSRLPECLRRPDPERSTLAAIRRRAGRQVAVLAYREKPPRERRPVAVPRPGPMGAIGRNSVRRAQCWVDSSSTIAGRRRRSEARSATEDWFPSGRNGLPGADGDEVGARIMPYLSRPDSSG
jgi:hypothetical protein